MVAAVPVTLREEKREGVERSEVVLAFPLDGEDGADASEERERVIRARWSAMRTNTLPNNVSAAESAVLKAFDRWEQDSRISVTSKKPQWKRSGDDYMTFECRVDASGTLPALTRFLYEVEQDPLALKVESVEITSRDNNGQQLSLALQVSGLMLEPPPQP